MRQGDEDLESVKLRHFERHLFQMGEIKTMGGEAAGRKKVLTKKEILYISLNFSHFMPAFINSLIEGCKVGVCMRYCEKTGI